MIHWSCIGPPSSGGWTWSFHCTTRPLLTNDPSLATQSVAGSWNTSVSMSFGFTPGDRQNSAPVVGSGSITHSHLNLDSASMILFESGPTLGAL